jgi:TRAP-type C4-dicarboxylate transport system permease small subunit
VVVSALKIVAILLIVAGIAGLVYGKFTYTKATHEAKIGPLDLSVKEKKTVNIPLWAGLAAIVAGGLLLAVPKRT